jgi:DNA-binding response OmpR family regulator
MSETFEDVMPDIRPERPSLPAARRILIVEDNNLVRQDLMELLASTPLYQPLEAANLAEASRYLDAADSRVDLVILDIGLPDGNGREFCIRTRRQGHKMPIILLTGAVGDDDIVRGLSAGANDYVAKPFRGNELLARLRAHLRVFDDSQDAVFTIGRYRFRPSGGVVTTSDDGTRILLSGKEVSVLKYLCRAGNRVTSRRVLLQDVWGYHPKVSTHTLESHIYRLRQKLEIDPANPCLLLTVPGGYVLNAAKA